MKISWVILTMNRRPLVEQSVLHNLKTAGAPIDEIVWVDNGSTDSTPEFMASIKPDVSILHKENLGVSAGYNRGFALSSGSHIVLTGCDMLMPDGWLACFKKYFESIPETGVAAMYCVDIEKVPERKRGEPETVNGLPIHQAMPMGRRMMSREFLKGCGYLREDFGLYGWEDIEWAERAERYARDVGKRFYMIPGMIADHLGRDSWPEQLRLDPDAVQKDDAYFQWKQAQAKDPEKLALLEKCRSEKWPYYNPYA